LLTLGTALDLARDLCATQVPPDLAVHPPIHLLAVDDEPMARRALTCALQMAFAKPESVDSGEAALALATDRPFVVIFMVVQMPGMDGFKACLAIHETEPNRNTPVVFVTSDREFKTRAQAATSGGSDFMTKPFLNAEITLKALTCALRGRFEKLKRAQQETMLWKEGKLKPDNLVPALA
jgi:CheY-like chemotaxis protein